MALLQLHRDVTQLENLPNELLLMIFRYLTIFDIYHAFYGLNSVFNLLITGEQLDFHLTEKMSLENTIFVVEEILPNLGKNTLRMIEINHNTFFWRLIKFNSLFSYTLIHTIHLKNLIQFPFAPVISILQQSSQLKHLQIQIESNKDSS